MSRDCPFKKGQSYRIKRTFASLRDNFIEGETLIFDYDAWSRYDGLTGYFFKDKNEKYRTWDIYDEENIDIWREYFEQI